MGREKDRVLLRRQICSLSLYTSPSARQADTGMYSGRYSVDDLPGLQEKREDVGNIQDTLGRAVKT